MPARSVQPGQQIKAATLLIDDLGHWETIGKLAYELHEGLQKPGHTELMIQTPQWKRLTEWGQRWVQLHPQLREFYKTFCDDSETVSVVLYGVLTGNPKLEGWQGVLLENLWEEHFLVPPVCELAPKVELEE